MYPVNPLRTCEWKVSETEEEQETKRLKAGGVQQRGAIFEDVEGDIPHKRSYAKGGPSPQRRRVVHAELL